jgi:integrase/recombinase XerD
MAGPVHQQSVVGPLAPYAAGFRAELEARGYTSGPVRLRLWLLDSLSRWLDDQGLVASDLTSERVEQFREVRRVRGYKTWVSMRSMELPLEYLRKIGAVPAPAVRGPQGPVEELLAAYCRYLIAERGLTEGTVRHYEDTGRRFLSVHTGLDGRDLGSVSAANITEFVVRECVPRSIPAAKYLVAGLRSLLRYLHLAGLTAAPLAAAVPSVAGWRGNSLPRGLEPAQVNRLLASCDRGRLVGRRDYAILTLLVRLGLRVAEAAALDLDDLDWHRGEVLLRGKGDRQERLPLPHDIGEALVGYLRGRPQAPEGCRRLFLRVNAPWGALARTGVQAVVHDACVRAGLAPVGAHRLRHTAATAMLQAGAALPEVAQVLRHRHLDATAIYAKVDRKALRMLAEPWPGSAQ